MTAFSEAFTVTVADVMETNLEYIHADATVMDVVQFLDRRGYNAAPVTDGEPTGEVTARGGTPVGYVQRPTMGDLGSEYASDPVRRHAAAIGLDDLVSPDTPLPELLDALRDRYFYFIGSRGGLDGVVTRADLNRPPVSAFLYTRIHEVERGLRRLVSRHDVDWESILESAPTPRGFPYESFLEQVRGTYERKRRAGLELAMLEYTSLTHLREVVRHSDLDAVLGVDADGVHEIKELRNDVAHPNERSVIHRTHRHPDAEGRDIEDLAQIFEDVQRCLAAVRGE